MIPINELSAKYLKTSLERNDTLKTLEILL